MTIDVPCPLWVISDGRADDVRFVPKADSCTAAKRYSISSLAVASSCGSILRPSDLAVLRLTTNMNLLGCTDIDLAKRKAAKLAALKLVWIRLEEHVWRSCSLLSIKIALRSGTVAQRVRRGLGRATAVSSFGTTRSPWGACRLGSTC